MHSTEEVLLEHDKTEHRRVFQNHLVWRPWRSIQSKKEIEYEKKKYLNRERPIHKKEVDCRKRAQ